MEEIQPHGAADASFAPLTPTSFLARAALVHPDRVAIVHGDARITYRTFDERARRLASALRRRGVRRGDTVAVLLPNTPAMLEAHYGVPLAGAVLNALNIRLDAPALAFCLAHGEARVLLVDRGLAEVAREAVASLDHELLVVDVDDELAPPGPAIGSIGYEELLAEGDPDHRPDEPSDERQPICLLYTSGTTGDPKGALYHARGAYLQALGNALSFGLTQRSVYLWTLPMFHCAGWSYTWAVTAVAGTHVCLRRLEPARVFELIAEHGVTHLCGAPIVLSLLAHAPPEERRPLPHPVEIATGGAAPTSTVIAAMEELGFRVTHLYGATETYGPSLICEAQPGWDALPLAERARLVARQGVPHPTVGEVEVGDVATLEPVPWDGATIGEVLVRGNTVMLGYRGNDAGTERAMGGGWYRSGDLAVRHPDGYIEVRDRAKDIIITGGENVSSLELEEIISRHPDVLEVAVVARPDERWGETPCAFVTLRPGATAEPEALTTWCRGQMAGFKVPRHWVVGELPKTATGKIQKHALRARLDAG